MKQKDALEGRYPKLAVRLQMSKVGYTGGVYAARKGTSFFKKGKKLGRTCYKSFEIKTTNIC